MESKDIKKIELTFPPELIKELERKGCIEKERDDYNDYKINNRNYNPSGFEGSQLTQFMINRATKWLFSRNCAIISPWRQLNQYRERIVRSENMANKRELAEALRSHEYNFVKVVGCYCEECNKKYAKEESFFVFDKDSGDFETFAITMVQLANEYNQDSVLVREPGEKSPALLIHSDGRVEKYENMRICSTSDESPACFTRFSNGIIYFENEPERHEYENK